MLSKYLGKLLASATVSLNIGTIAIAKSAIAVMSAKIKPAKRLPNGVIFFF